MAERTPLLAGNWKMHLDHLAAIQVVQQLVYHLVPDDYEAAEIAVCPPFTALRSIQTLIEGDRLRLSLGAQNCHWEDAGAYTGEVSPPMLGKLKVAYVICGHSERRQHLGETDETVNRKVRAVLAHDMTPILCVGETLEQREAGDAEAVVDAQLRAGLDGVDAEQVGDLVVAYEPVWAIGTGHAASANDAQSMSRYIRDELARLFETGTADKVPILYGGSVKAANAESYFACPDVDGALVGGASLDASEFAQIVAAAG
jgi:triosephosphate isomerase (TIM)